MTTHFEIRLRKNQKPDKTGKQHFTIYWPSTRQKDVSSSYMLQCREPEGTPFTRGQCGFGSVQAFIDNVTKDGHTFSYGPEEHWKD